jgi:hypothetical protein
VRAGLRPELAVEFRFQRDSEHAVRISIDRHPAGGRERHHDRQRRLVQHFGRQGGFEHKLRLAGRSGRQHDQRHHHRLHRRRPVRRRQRDARGGRGTGGGRGTTGAGGTTGGRSTSAGASDPASGGSTTGDPAAGLGTGSLNYGGSYTTRNTPEMIPPSVVGGNPCSVGASGGVSLPGFGVALGGTWADKACERRQQAALLYNMGEQKVALELLMCQDDSVRNAMRTSGKPCIVDTAPVAQVPAVASMPVAAATAAPTTVAQATPVVPAWCAKAAPTTEASRPMSSRPAAGDADRLSPPVRPGRDSLPRIAGEGAAPWTPQPRLSLSLG